MKVYEIFEAEVAEEVTVEACGCLCGISSGSGSGALANGFEEEN